MKKIWKSNMNRKIKVRLFRPTCWIRATGQLRDLDHKQKHAEKNRPLLHQNRENGNQYIMERENKQWSSLLRPTATFPNNKGKKNETSKSLHKTHCWDVTQTFPLETNSWEKKWRLTTSHLHRLPERRRWSHKHRRNKDCNDGKTWMEEMCQVRSSWRST